MNRLLYRESQKRPHPDPPKLRARPGPALLAPRPRSTLVPPTPTTVKRIAKRYMPVTEDVTPPISPARVAETDPATPLPIYPPGKGRGRGKWRSQYIETTDVGARRNTKPAETPATHAQALRASWPDQSDQSLQITCLAHNLQLRNPTEDRFTDIQRTLTTYKIDENQNNVRLPAAGIHSHQQNVYFIPPPARRWWRRGGFSPSKHGTSGVDSSRSPITGDTTPRGPSLSGSTRHTPESTIHHAPRAHRPAWSACGLTTMGGGSAFSWRTVRECNIKELLAQSSPI